MVRNCPIVLSSPFHSSVCLLGELANPASLGTMRLLSFATPFKSITYQLQGDFGSIQSMFFRWNLINCPKFHEITAKNSK